MPRLNCFQQPSDFALRMAARLLMAGCLLSGPAGAQAQSALTRLGDITGDQASRVAAAGLYDGRLVTATVEGTDKLALTAWDVFQDGKFTRRGDAEANGTSTEFVLVATGATGVVSAVKAQNGALKLIDWSVAADGSISRNGEIGAGVIERLAAVAVGDSRVLTASQGKSGKTELIVWDVDGSGAFTRRGDIVTSAGSAVAVAVLSPTLVASVIRNDKGLIEIATFSLSASGDLAALGSATGAAVSTVAAAGTALDRVVTASKLANGDLGVQVWTVKDGLPVLSGSKEAGKADEIAVAALTGVKAATALRQADGTLAVITWQVSGEVARLDKIAGGKAGPLALVALGWDRIVTPVQAEDGTLKLIDWGDQSVSLIPSSWTASSPIGQICGAAPTATAGGGAKKKMAPSMKESAEEDEEEAEERNGGHDDEGVSGFPEERQFGPARSLKGLEQPVIITSGPPDPPTPVSPAPALTFQPDIGGVDPMVAVGKQYVVVSEDHRIEFIAKSGANAGKQLSSKAGEPTCLSSTSFFAGFTSPKAADGSVNRSNIDLYQRFPANSGANLQCDPNDASLPGPCIDEFYDTRVAYDPYRGRFIVLAAARGNKNSLSLTNTAQQNETARRYTAIAVSRSEDPRDGFDQWMTTESAYTDWPRMATADGILIAANNGCKDSDENPICSNSPFASVPLSARSRRPMAVVFNLDDMIAKAAMPRNFRIDPYQVGGGGTIYPVIHHGDAKGWTYMVQPQSGALALWRFPKIAADWKTPPTLSSTNTNIDGGMNGFREGVTFQNGALYFSAADLAAARKPNVAPARYRARGMRIDVTSTKSNFSLAQCPGSGCLDFSFGIRDGDDGEKDTFSYEMPSLAVTGKGDMVVVHGRAPVSKASIGQEARYRVYYHDQRGLQDGAVLHTGSPALTGIFCQNGSAETTPTVENYFHIYYGDSVCKSQKNFQDYGTAFSDPDGTSVWVAHAFAVSSGYKMIVGKVTP